jgi:sulfhydrogenase subunit delta
MTTGHAMTAGRAERAERRASLAVWKFASCDGCQLSLLDCEDELLLLAESVDIAHFTEMSSATVAGPYDLSLVEGSITTEADALRIQEVRRQTRRLITIGACATAGGIQGLRNFAASGSYRSAVYAHPDYIASLDSSTAISDHVIVDYELQGCPIDKHQLLEVILAALAGRRPAIAGYSVCQDCKARGTVCLLVAHGTPCLGPVTRTGCGALCPSIGRGCFGCFGPSDSANTASLAMQLRRGGLDPRETGRLFRTFNAGAPAFREESMAQEAQEHEEAPLSRHRPSAPPTEGSRR